MDQSTHLIQCLKYFHSKQWINQYFDFLKKILTELNIRNDDPRLGLSLNGNNTMPVNFGHRWVLEPFPEQYVRCIVPATFEEASIKGTLIGFFSPNTKRDAKWIEFRFLVGSPFPQTLYNACIDASMDILKSSERSRSRRFHVPLLYDLTMEPSVRNEILAELTKQTKGSKFK